MMLNGYRLQPKEQAGSYRELFSRLLSNKGPLIVNCTAGKDRTGVASALVLTALGVPYETVREDYLLSNGAPGMAMLASSLPGPFASLPPETMRLLAGVDASYLDAAFDQIRKDYGSVDGYLKNELGMGPKQIKLLRGIMLAPVRLLTVWA
jgi:protein-tyrosine phosphatase